MQQYTCVCLRLIDAEIACSAPEEEEEEEGEVGENCNWKAEDSFMFGFSHAMMIIFHTHLHIQHTHIHDSVKKERRGTKIQ